MLFGVGTLYSNTSLLLEVEVLQLAMLLDRCAAAAMCEALVKVLSSDMYEGPGGRCIVRQSMEYVWQGDLWVKNMAKCVCEL